MSEEAANATNATEAAAQTPSAEIPPGGTSELFKSIQRSLAAKDGGASDGDGEASEAGAAEARGTEGAVEEQEREETTREGLDSGEEEAEEDPYRRSAEYMRLYEERQNLDAALKDAAKQINDLKTAQQGMTKAELQKLFKKNPLKALEKVGVSYNEFLESYLNPQEVGDDAPEENPTEKELQDLRAMVQEMRRTQELYPKVEQTIHSLTEAHHEDFPTLRLPGVLDRVTASAKNPGITGEETREEYLAYLQQQEQVAAREMAFWLHAAGKGGGLQETSKQGEEERRSPPKKPKVAEEAASAAAERVEQKLSYEEKRRQFLKTIARQ